MSVLEAVLERRQWKGGMVGWRPAHIRISKELAAQKVRARCKTITGPVSYTHLTLPTICSV
eukprot:93180-Alexandrium_andersonii.AAC.1